MTLHSDNRNMVQAEGVNLSVSYTGPKQDGPLAQLPWKIGEGPKGFRSSAKIAHENCAWFHSSLYEKAHKNCEGC